ncbi:caspase Dronc [Bactrocera neohumeralis]|uniref:caspase Dronc n=1 Tax=Bactrocera tryoni TaxID=59916 RepID=UPI001A991F01|nr:caspase Dronc [Bactrocera tryoni]XP_050334494.1 caspase Dronc [Bactrocera neohumeralis]
MDDKHRKIIKENINKLIQHTELKPLLQACRSAGLLSEQMVYNLHLDSKSMVDGGGSQTLDQIMHKKLFDKITHRGPEAFDKLKQILKDLDYVEALQVLERLREFNAIREYRQNLPQAIQSITEKPIELIPAPATDIPDSVHSRVDENSTPNITEFLESVDPKVKYEVTKANQINTCERIGTYKMQSKQNRGVLFIANYIKFKTDYRNGASNDSDILIYVFRQLGFKIFITTNGSKEQFFDLLDALLKSDVTLKTESFVLAFMSHGELDGKNEEEVAFSDGSFVKVQEVIDRFSNRRCPNLMQKPKVLIFPFCRGPMQDKGIKAKTETDTIPFTSNKDRNAELSDLLICYATNKGFKAYRDAVTGSWYIQGLCKAIAEHAHDTHFEDILKIVQRNIGEMYSENGSIQMGNFRNIGFNYKLFFNPGHSQE